MKTKFLIFFLFCLQNFEFSVHLYCQTKENIKSDQYKQIKKEANKIIEPNHQIISTEEFFQKLDSIKNSDYMKLLEYIDSNDINAYKNKVSDKNLENTITQYTFKIDSIEFLLDTLNSLYPETNYIKLTVNDLGVNVKNSDHKYSILFEYKMSGTSLNGLKNNSTNRYYINLPTFTITGFTSNKINIQIIENSATIFLSDYVSYMPDLFSLRRKTYKNSIFDLCLGLIKNDEMFSPALYAFKHGKKQIFNYILDQNILITEKYTFNNKHIAFHSMDNNNSYLFEKIYNKLEEPKTIYYKGMNLLHYAAHTNKTEPIDFLINNGFSFYTPTISGDFPIHLAAEGNSDACEHILEKDSSLIAQTDKLGQTPLHHAAKKGNIESIQVLLSNHASIDAKDKNGTTPLMLASEHNKFSVVKLLLEHKANYMLTDNENLNNIHYAINGYKCYNVKYFLRHKTYNYKTQTFTELREFGRYHKSSCNSILVLTRTFHAELKFQFNLTKIDYAGAKYLLSGGYGAEFSQRILPFVDLSYTINRLYIESNIRNTEELQQLQLSDDHYGSYETNYIDNIFSTKIYPVHYLNKNAPFIRIGYSYRKMKESGLLGGTSQITDDLSDIANKSYKGINLGIGYMIRGGGRFSMELNYTYGLSDINVVFPGSYNTFAFIVGLGF